MHNPKAKLDSATQANSRYQEERSGQCMQREKGCLQGDLKAGKPVTKTVKEL